MTALALHDVTLARGGRVLARGLDVTMTAGGALVFTGPNGAGKSSLLRLAAGLLRPVAGRVERPARAALMAEADALDRERPLAAALGFWARLDMKALPSSAQAGAQLGNGQDRGLHPIIGTSPSRPRPSPGRRGREGRSDLDQVVAAALEAVRLETLAEVPVRLLSTGQRRRAALARVVASGAPLWLLDEPANGLDADAVARLEALILRHRAAGGSVVVATHLPLDLPGADALVLG